jgi:hypothetical protein
MTIDIPAARQMQIMPVNSGSIESMRERGREEEEEGDRERGKERDKGGEREEGEIYI